MLYYLICVIPVISLLLFAFLSFHPLSNRQSVDRRLNTSTSLAATPRHSCQPRVPPWPTPATASSRKCSQHTWRSRHWPTGNSGSSRWSQSLCWSRTITVWAQVLSMTCAVPLWPGWTNSAPSTPYGLVSIASVCVVHSFSSDVDVCWLCVPHLRTENEGWGTPTFRPCGLLQFSSFPYVLVTIKMNCFPGSGWNMYWSNVTAHKHFSICAV